MPSRYALKLTAPLEQLTFAERKEACIVPISRSPEKRTVKLIRSRPLTA